MHLTPLSFIRISGIFEGLRSLLAGSGIRHLLFGCPFFLILPQKTTYGQHTHLPIGGHFVRISPIRSYECESDRTADWRCGNGFQAIKQP
jgi:hypothetical protein